MRIRYVHGQVLTFSMRALYRFAKALGVMSWNIAGRLETELVTLARKLGII